MPSFEITASNEVDLDQKKRTGKASFTVTNKTDGVVRANLKVAPVPDDAAQAAWYRIEGETLRSFAAKAAEPVPIAIAVGTDVAPGPYTFRLDAIGEENPDEDVTRGQSVTFTVEAPKEEKKKFPFWIPIVAVIVLLGIAATVYFATRPDDKPPPPPPPTVTAVPEQPVAFTVEAESLLPAGGPSRDKVQVQSQDCCQGLQWSDGKQAWFTANAVGESMTLRFHVDRTGYYEMVAVMTKAIDYGTIELSIDGVDLATNFNGVNDGVITVEQNFAPNGLALTAGDHVLRVTTVQPSAIAGRVYAGIDKITFTPTQRIRRVDIDRIKVLTEENKILIKP